jgi:hypothetical protein
MKNQIFSLKAIKAKLIEKARAESKKSIRERFFSFRELLPLIVIYGVLFIVVAVNIWGDR